jgi:alkaline phosphatase D
MLGQEQERWLERCFAESRARWNLIGQQTLFSAADRRQGPGRSVWTDGWDGYPASRQRLIDAMLARELANPVILGGDVHSNWVCDVKADFADPGSRTVAAEFCGTSITSQGRAQVHMDRAREENPHIRLAESLHRGYSIVELNAERCRTRLRTLDDVKLPAPKVSTRAEFTVLAGQPGVQA